MVIEVIEYEVGDRGDRGDRSDRGDRGDKENGDKGDKGPAHGIIHSKHVHVTRVDTLIHENRWNFKRN